MEPCRMSKEVYGMKLKVIGSDLCPDTRDALERLDAIGAGYEFLNITASTENLAEFLKIRDTDENYIPVRERGGIGIPYFVFDDGTKTLDTDEALAKLG